MRNRFATELRLTQPPLQRMTMYSALSLHFVEGFLENFEIAGVAGFFARSLDPFLLQRILRWSVRFVEDAEDAGKGNCGEFVRGDFIRDVMPQFVLGCAVPFLFLNDFEAAPFLDWLDRTRPGKIRRIQTNIR